MSTMLYYTSLPANEYTYLNMQWSLPIGNKPGNWMPKISKSRVYSRGYHFYKRNDLLGSLDKDIYVAEIMEGVPTIYSHGVGFTSGPVRLVRRLTLEQGLKKALAKNG